MKINHQFILIQVSIKWVICLYYWNKVIYLDQRFVPYGFWMRVWILDIRVYLHPKNSKYPKSTLTSKTRFFRVRTSDLYSKYHFYKFKEKKVKFWTREENIYFQIGVMKFGKGQWSKIHKEFSGKFNNRSRNNLQQHYTQLEKSNQLNFYYKMAQSYVKRNNIKLWYNKR